MNSLISAIVAIIVVLLYLKFIMPEIPQPFGWLILILIVVMGFVYGWRNWPR